MASMIRRMQIRAWKKGGAVSKVPLGKPFKNERGQWVQRHAWPLRPTDKVRAA